MRQRISVALCTRNGERFLAQQLDSIARQTRPPDEIVACDDRSEDATRYILESFARSAGFPVRVHGNRERLGTAKNFEQAIALSSGEIIALADQDDVWRPEKLAKLESVLAARPEAGAAISDAALVDAELRPLGRTLWQNLSFGARDRRRVANGRMVEVLLKRNVACGNTMAFRASFRSLVLPIPPQWEHDPWIALLIAMVAEIALIDQPLIDYRQHAGQQIGGETRPMVTAGELAETSRDLLANQRTFSDRGAENCRLALVRFTRALERLDASGLLAADSPRRTRLAEKVAHFEARVGLPDKRLQRIPAVLRELGSGRYGRYSRGLFSLAKDLVR